MLYVFGLSFALHFCRLHVQHLFEHGSRSLLGTLLFARLAVGNDGWFAITIHFIFREEAPIVCLRHLSCDNDAKLPFLLLRDGFEVFVHEELAVPIHHEVMQV